METPYTIVRVQAVSEEINEFKVISLLVEEGAVVQKEQGICELETDKVILEIPATSAGTVRWLVKAGDTICVGDALCHITL